VLRVPFINAMLQVSLGLPRALEQSGPMTTRFSFYLYSGLPFSGPPPGLAGKRQLLAINGPFLVHWYRLRVKIRMLFLYQ
jgi:hypothetical protein